MPLGLADPSDVSPPELFVAAVARIAIVCPPNLSALACTNVASFVVANVRAMFTMCRLSFLVKIRNWLARRAVSRAILETGWLAQRVQFLTLSPLL